MENKKKLGIWMDHSSALLMEVTNDSIIENSIVSESTHLEKADSLAKGEKHMHIKDQHQQASYYKKICDAIKNYQEVVLTGPTDAKDELLNLLRTDHLFKNIKIEVKHSDKMTKNQMNAFVKEYFK